MALAAMVPLAHANTQVVHVATLNASATLATPLLAGDNLLLDALVTTETGGMLQRVNFTVGAATTMTGSAAWEVTPASSAGPRLVGVNIDIFDANNVLVVSDTFGSLVGAFALSSLTKALPAGSYTLVATGTAVRTGSLDIQLNFAGPPDLVAAAATVPIVTGSLITSSTIATPLVAGDTLFADVLVTTETGALIQTINFTAGNGVVGFTSEASWGVTPAGGTGQRLVGVNIDLFDSSNAFLFSDTFNSLSDSWAVSSFFGTLAPGSYTLRATGTAVRDASLNMSLTLLGNPGPSQVPEPGSLLLTLLGLLGAVITHGRAHKPIS
jgi:hypothetical protein